MTLPVLKSRFVIYLLHFDQPVAGVRHYVGITRPKRLADRMREHVAGRGAKLTAAAKIAGSGFALARVFPAENPEEEEYWANRIDLLPDCPVCQKMAPLRHYPWRSALSPAKPLDAPFAFPQMKTDRPR